MHLEFASRPQVIIAVTGWNITYGEFYRTREGLAVQILKTGLHEMKGAESKWIFYDLLEWLERDLNEDERVSSADVPAYWRESMKKHFLRNIIQWTIKHKLELEDGYIVNLPQTANWKWGPDRVSEEFKGIFQLQHTKIVVAIGKKKVTIPILDIIGSPDFEVGPTDVALEEIKFRKLEEAIKKRAPYNVAKHYFTYMHPDLQDDFISINDDSSLHGALLALQEHMCDEVDFQLRLRKAKTVCYA